MAMFRTDIIHKYNTTDAGDERCSYKLINYRLLTYLPYLPYGSSLQKLHTEAPYRSSIQKLPTEASSSKTGF